MDPSKVSVPRIEECRSGRPRRVAVGSPSERIPACLRRKKGAACRGHNLTHNEGCHASSAAGAIRPAGPRANGGSGPGTRDGEAATAPCGDWSARGNETTLGLFLEAMTRQRSSFAPGVAPGRSHGRTYCRSG